MAVLLEELLAVAVALIRLEALATPQVAAHSSSLAASSPMVVAIIADACSMSTTDFARMAALRVSTTSPSITTASSPNSISSTTSSATFTPGSVAGSGCRRPWRSS
ncbi:MAG: hypothetical protein IPL61_06775 [Myxococcales bacterium]|nr:hypothetical protein [Myxococcales bacterium]